MDFIWILFAFVCGLLVKMIALPPLIGFLVAGFLLHTIGVTPDAGLDTLADLGITLMLFTIGLKLHVKDLLKTEVWASTLSHMGLWTLLFGSLLFVAAALAMPYFAGLDLAASALIAFAMSFSSTVCIVKLLEESGEMKTRHGQTAIGVLVMQDIAAVIFLVFATGQVPSIWAFSLLGLIFIRPLLEALLSRTGHGEMLPLSGFFLALGGYELFSLVGIKGDLGALILGVLLSHHPKATELSKSLMSFKDIFLIGFFLSIGFTALPTWSMLATAALISGFIVLKFVMFFLLLTRLKLRGRTAFLSSLALSNFSEFGLIVAALGTDYGWLPKEWLVILALAVSLSFAMTSILYRYAHTLYQNNSTLFKRYELATRLKEDIFTQPPDAEILVIGLGRVGKGTFRALQNIVDQRVAGMDASRQRILEYQAKGLNVFFGDGEDADLWESLDTRQIKLILLALPSIEDCKNITQQLLASGYQGRIAAIARYADDRQHLLDAGIDCVFNFYAEAGLGFAEESLLLIGENPHTPH